MFLDRYEIHETIGEGGFAKVKLATHKLTRERVAIKMINRKSANSRFVRFDLEIKAMKELFHDNICQLYEHYQNDNHIFLVLEYCSGGELFEYIVANDRIPEKDARLFFRQILSAVGYIHNSGYAHRDLKPENLLLNENGHVKLTDFGLCARPEKGMHEFLSTRCGSPCYIAPEILEGHSYLGCQSDVWSLGILLFTLVAGYLPYESDNISVLLRKIKQQPLQLPSFLSSTCKNVISRMLEVEPDCRSKVEDLCNDAWVTNFYEEAPVVCYGSSKRTKKNRIDMDIVRFLSDQIFLSVEATKLAVETNNFEFLHSAYLIIAAMKKRGVLYKMERYYRYRFTKDMQHFDPLPPAGSCTDRLVCSCEDSACLAHVKENNSSNQQYRKRNDYTSPISSPLKVDIKRFLMERSICALKRKQPSSSPQNGLSNNRKTRAKEDPIAECDRAIANSIHPDNNESTLLPNGNTFYVPLPSVPVNDVNQRQSVDEDVNFQSPKSKKRRAVFKEIEKGINAAVKRVLTPIKKKAMEKSPFIMFTRKRGPRMCKDQINVCLTSYECSVKLVFALEHVLNSLFANEKVQFTRNVYTFRVTVRDDLICKLEAVALPNTYFGVRRKRICGNVFAYKAFTMTVMNRLRSL
ncbi:hypothetical protein GJ496_007918 [Pomphorhynchus laevis]|nr:hypothetical protein GJ496_007918 [Pomphorhynchus laevis]